MLDDFSFKILLLLKTEKAARFKDLKSIVKNPRTLSSKLRRLIRLGLVEAVNGRYGLTQNGLEVSRMLEQLNRTLYSSRFMVESVERIPHAYFAPVIRKYCEILYRLLESRLTSIMLFGSVARGDWDKNSDIDILVIGEGWEDKPIWERVKELMRAKEKLEESLEYVEALRAGYWPIIQNYPLSLKEARNFNRIYLDAVIDGIILYDKDCFLNNILQSLRIQLEEMGSVRVTFPNRRFYWALKEMEAGEVMVLG
ncbi:MAG: nucleotidyltransferase domain-containing protein [Nitrososphaeria archaeon]